MVQDVTSSSLLGAAVAIGSETSGGVRNVTVRGLHTRDTSLALSIKTERGRGGVIEDVTFENVRVRGTGCAAIEVSVFVLISVCCNEDDNDPLLRTCSPPVAHCHVRLHFR